MTKGNLMTWKQMIKECDLHPYSGDSFYKDQIFREKEIIEIGMATNVRAMILALGKPWHTKPAEIGVQIEVLYHGVWMKELAGNCFPGKLFLESEIDKAKAWAEAYVKEGESHGPEALR